MSFSLRAGVAKTGTYSTGSTLPITYAGAITASDLLLADIIAVGSATVTVSSVTDDQGNTWSKLFSTGSGSGLAELSTWYCLSALTTATPVVTIHLSGSPNSVTKAQISAFSTGGSGATVDATITNSGFSGSSVTSVAITGGATSPANNNSLLHWTIGSNPINSGAYASQSNTSYAAIATTTTVPWGFYWIQTTASAVADTVSMTGTPGAAYRWGIGAFSLASNAYSYTITETLAAIADSITRGTGFSISNTLPTLTDKAVVGFAPKLGDVLPAIADALSLRLGFSISNTLPTLQDKFASGIGSKVTEGLPALTDTTRRAFSFSIADTLPSLADIVAQVAIGTLYIRNVAETLPAILDQVLAPQLGRGRTILESLPVIADQVVQRGFGLRAADTLTLSDSTSMGVGRTLRDTLPALADQVASLAFGRVRSVADSLPALADTIRRGTGFAINETLPALADTIMRNYLRIILEALPSLADLAGRGFTLTILEVLPFIRDGSGLANMRTVAETLPTLLDSIPLHSRGIFRHIEERLPILADIVVLARRGYTRLIG